MIALPVVPVCSLPVHCTGITSHTHTHTYTVQLPECCNFGLSLPSKEKLILCFVDCASLYNLVNKTNLVHNLFFVYLSISTCFRRPWAHHQGKQLCLCDTWYLLFCVDDCLNSTLHTRQSSTQNNKYQVSHKHSCTS